jgi:hypothetical protein
MSEEVKALRYDQGKLDWTLLDWKALEPLVKVMMYGAKKYTVTKEDGTVIDGRDNWKNKCDDPMQHIRCAFRHLIAIASGEDVDPESHERHLGHVMANMMMFSYHTGGSQFVSRVASEASMCQHDFLGTTVDIQD